MKPQSTQRKTLSPPVGGFAYPGCYKFINLGAKAPTNYRDLFIPVLKAGASHLLYMKLQKFICPAL